MEVRFLTFNIHKGLDWKNDKLTISLLREALKNLNPDVIFLQEIVGENQKLEKTMDDWVSNQVEFLAQNIWEDSAYSKHALFDHRNHGNAILSKYPITLSEVKDISLNPLEQRAILFSQIDFPDQTIHCYCTHLNLLHRDRMKQYKSISSYIKQTSPLDTPVVFAGDFNDWNQKASRNLFDIAHFHDAYKTIHGDYARSFPSFYPWFKLDRIYTKGIQIKSAEVLTQNGWDKISDHLPILINGNI